jgi:hypothetical protein
MADSDTAAAVGTVTVTARRVKLTAAVITGVTLVRLVMGPGPGARPLPESCQGQ